MPLLRIAIRISPTIVILCLTIIVAFSAAVDHGRGFDVIGFFINEEPEFSLAVIIAFIENVGILVAAYLGSKPNVGGIWNVLVTPTNWRGQTNLGIRGKGSMYVARSKYSENNYADILHLRYNDHANNSLLEATYEIRLTMKRNKATGK